MANELSDCLKFLETVDCKNLQDHTFYKFTQLATISHAMFPGKLDMQIIHENIQGIEVH